MKKNRLNIKNRFPLLFIAWSLSSVIFATCHWECKKARDVLFQRYFEGITMAYILTGYRVEIEKEYLESHSPIQSQDSIFLKVKEHQGKFNQLKDVHDIVEIIDLEAKHSGNFSLKAGVKDYYKQVTQYIKLITEIEDVCQKKLKGVLASCQEVYKNQGMSRLLPQKWVRFRQLEIEQEQYGKILDQLTGLSSVNNQKAEK